jgi:glutathione S-transferase
LRTAWLYLTFALALRRALAQKTPDELEARLRSVRDPDLRERQLLAVTKGLDAPSARSAIASFDALVGEMEESLRDSRFLAGDSYSLADAAVTPYLLRAEMLGMDGLWIDRRPSVARWFDRLRARPSFEDALVRVMTDADRQRLTVARDETWPRVREILDGAVS